MIPLWPRSKPPASASPGRSSARRSSGSSSRTRRPRSTSSSRTSSRSAPSSCAARGTRSLLASPEELEHGVWTASAGNMAQGVAWWARQLGVPLHGRPSGHGSGDQDRSDPPARRGHDPGHLRRVARGLPHAHVRGPRRPASCTPSATTRSWPGTARSGSRSSRTCPTSDAILAPYGGGGLSCGIASALRAVAPACKVFAAEVATGRAARPVARGRASR